MMRNETSQLASDPQLLKRLRGLVIGRIIVIFVLLLATWWWTNSFLEQSIGPFPQWLFFFYAFAAVMTAVYYALLETGLSLTWQIRTQFVVDAFLITGLVWQTGDVFSPLIFLYIVLVAVTGYFLRKLDTLLIAALSAASFTILAFSASRSLIGGTNDDQPVSRVVQTIAFNIVGILIVGLLSARLAERRRISEELRYTTESFADLHILHERIVESIGTGLATTDLEGRIFAFNQAAEQISGVPAATAIGRPIFDLFGDAGRAHIENCLSEIRAGRPASVRFEADAQRVAEAEPARVLECSATPLLAKTGRANGLIVTFQDITKVRALEESLRRSDRLAAIGRMAAGLAHEIRNPLGSMSSALQFLDGRTPAATEESSLMKVVLRESDRLNSIISNFLAYARPSANGLARQAPAAVDVAGSLRDCLALLSHSPEKHDGHRIEFEAPAGELVMNVNETEIKQVFWNLLRNALAAMPDGGTLSVDLASGDDGRVSVRIADTGTGMNGEQLEHLFEPFAAGSNGTGLGLSIVHKIVTDHGGRIDVESSPGRGTSFVIELPAKSEAGRAAEA